MKLAGTANISVAEMIEGDGRLDQSLIEFSRIPPVFGPEFLPHLVAFVVVALIEFFDALQIERIVEGRRIARCHGRLLRTVWTFP